MLEHATYLQLARCPTKGRCLIAARDIPRNTVILRQPPYASVSKSPFFCSECLEALPVPAKSRPFLCETCKSEDSVGFGIKDKSLMILCYKVSLRMVREKNFSYDRFVEIKNHPTDLDDASYLNNYTAIAGLCVSDLAVAESDVDKVTNMLLQHTTGLSEEQVRVITHHVYSTFQCNVQGIRCISEEKQGQLCEERIGSAIYLTLALFNHSCLPNTMIYFEKSAVVVVTTVDVSHGQELFHNYGPDVLRLPKLERQRALERQYMFLCECTACSDEELAYAHKCENCSGPIWIDDDINTCGTCQQLIQRDRYSNRINSVFEMFYIISDHGRHKHCTVETVDKLVAESTALFTEQNVLFGNIMDDCAAYYSAIKAWELAIRCATSSCNVVKDAVGEQSQTYALELMKLCMIRLTADKEGFVVCRTVLMADVKFCVVMLSKSKFDKFKTLDCLTEWISPP